MVLFFSMLRADRDRATSRLFSLFSRVWFVQVCSYAECVRGGMLVFGNIISYIHSNHGTPHDHDRRVGYFKWQAFLTMLIYYGTGLSLLLLVVQELPTMLAGYTRSHVVNVVGTYTDPRYQNSTRNISKIRRKKAKISQNMNFGISQRNLPFLSISFISRNIFLDFGCFPGFFLPPK